MMKTRDAQKNERRRGPTLRWRLTGWLTGDQRIGRERRCHSDLADRTPVLRDIECRPTTVEKELQP